MKNVVILINKANTNNNFHNILRLSDFLMFYQISVSLQAKRCTIISNKHGMYELPHEFLNNLRLRKSRNQEIMEKLQN